MKKNQQLIDDIRQLRVQYLKEVPSGYRAWPKSIKERGFQLLEAGVSVETVAKETEIPAPTIYTWRSKPNQKQNFLPVKVVESPPARKEGPHKRARRKPLTITVIVPNGTRFEGCDTSAAIKIAREFQSWT